MNGPRGISSGEIYTKSVKPTQKSCSSCGLQFFSNEITRCPACGNHADESDTINYGNDGEKITDPKLVKFYQEHEEWGCGYCGGINNDKPKTYTGQNVNCSSCRASFEIDNWIKPREHFQKLTFREENDYEAEFIKAYYDAWNIARENGKAEEFYTGYMELHHKLVEENIFDRDDEMEELFKYITDYPKQFQKTDEIIERNGEMRIQTARNETNEKTFLALANKNRFFLGCGIIGVPALGFLVMQMLAPDIRKLEYQDHVWEITTPREKNKYERHEIFNNKNTSKYREYERWKKNPERDVIFIGNSEMGNGTYETVNDGPEYERDVPGSCKWIYKTIQVQEDDPSQPIYKNRQVQDCVTVYKNVSREECVTVRNGEMREKQCRRVTDRVSDGQNCKTRTVRDLVGYKKRPVDKRVRDEEICKREMYQPTRQVENMDPSIIFKARKWQEVSPHVSSGTGLTPKVDDSKIGEHERIDTTQSETTYAINIILTDEDGNQVSGTVDLGEDKIFWENVPKKLDCDVDVGVRNIVTKKQFTEECIK